MKRSTNLAKAGQSPGGLSMTPPQLRAVDLYVEGMSITDIAKKVQRTRTTVYAWLDTPEAIAEIDRQVKNRRRRLRHRVEAMCDDAADVLHEIATKTDSEGKPVNDAPARVSASRALLSIGVPTREEVEVSGPEGGPIPVEVTSQAVTLELSKLFGDRKPEEGA